MESLNIQMLEFEGMEIAATIETESTDEHPIYYPCTVLIFMQEGQCNLKIDKQLHVIPEGSFFLIRKYTHGKCFKTWARHQKGAKSIVFVFQDKFIHKIIDSVIKSEETGENVAPSLIRLPGTSLLNGLMDSLKAYFQGETKLDKEIIQLKTLEALISISRSNPEVAHSFSEFSQAERADLMQFMNHNFMYNFSLGRMASMSGRSLSTFHRDFKSIYNQSPHKWIMQQRLQLARKMMVQSGKKASEVYLEVGFEDLAHFSKRFKSQYGVNPSEVHRLAN